MYRTEERLDLILEEETYHHDGNHGHDDLQQIIRLVVALQTLSPVFTRHDLQSLKTAEETLEKVPYLLPEHDYSTEDRSGMDHCSEQKIISRLNAENLLSNLKMSAAADRKKLRKSLNQTK